MPPPKGVGERKRNAALCRHNIPRKYLLKDVTSLEPKGQWHFGQSLSCQTSD